MLCLNSLDKAAKMDGEELVVVGVVVIR